MNTLKFFSFKELIENTDSKKVDEQLLMYKGLRVVSITQVSTEHDS